VKARSNLILKMIESLGDALRTKYGSPFLDLVAYRDSAVRLAERLSSIELLKRLDALQSLVDSLAKNVQEALAIEVAFLRAFGPAAQKPADRLAKERVAR
jgi:hypothetical protein